jgi:hypothetical protein
MNGVQHISELAEPLFYLPIYFGGKIGSHFRENGRMSETERTDKWINRGRVTVPGNLVGNRDELVGDSTLGGYHDGYLMPFLAIPPNDIHHPSDSRGISNRSAAKFH